jgi:DNA repair exonuclease SbcCD ATPase subunit
MRLLSVDIENFLSIEKAHIDFDDAGLLLFEGWNYDVDRANGAGKTAILNAISFALYDRVPRKVTATELLKRGTKHGSVVVRVASGSSVFRVERSRPKGVKFSYEVGSEISPLSITQEEFEAKLRLTYNQFIVAVYCSQTTSNTSPRFLLLNDADKKQFLLQLLNLDEFGLCKKKADDNIQLILTQINQIHSQLAVINSKIEAYSESAIDENAINLEIAKLEDSRDTFTAAWMASQSVIKPDLAKYQKLEEDISTKRSEFTRLRAQREMLDNRWNDLRRKVVPFDGTDTCAACGSSVDNRHAKDMHEKQMAKIQQERQEIKQKIDVIDASLLGEPKILDLQQKVREKKRQESMEYERAHADEMQLSMKIEMIKGKIRDLRDDLLENVALQERLANFRMQRDVHAHKVITLTKDLEVQKTVASIYSPTGAPAYVLDSAVQLFNEQISKYTSILWSNLTYELQSYKENVRGEVTAKFSESIVMDGKSISLGSLSGGELKALSICADMALLGLLEQQFGIHMSPIIFDEAFDGLDSSGKEFALELIKGLAQDRLVIVIDHASEMRTSFDKVIRVEKRNGTSTVIA